VRDGIDVHMPGYFVDPHADTLRGFLAEQRARRVERLQRMLDRLAERGVELDADEILTPARADASRAAGRPWIAHAMVGRGSVASTREAFDVWLARGRPAFVARTAADPAEVIQRIHEAGGVASLAHPGLLRRDEWIPSLGEAGLDAIEAYYTEHDDDQTRRYL